MSDTPGRLQLKQEADQLVVSGAIDETAAVGDLVGRARAGKLTLDLAGVNFINSLGVRDWIRMQAAATKAGIKVELRRVSEPLVHQLNMIIATRGTATVTSFYAPYACDACGREESILVDAVANGASLAQLEAPAITCPECSAQMAFNDFPERYFSFLSV
jgi:ABC-type transporter Mla MlaB component/DNA-directed RNA polymerase subunit RPC12/RpoP